MLRYFVGMTNEETSEILGLSVATVKNYWTFARTWLFQAIKDSLVLRYWLQHLLLVALRHLSCRHISQRSLSIEPPGMVPLVDSI